MKRTLSISLDDEEKTIITEGVERFSVIELFGLAEHVHLKARIIDIRLMDEADAKAEKKKAPPKNRMRPAARKPTAK